MNKVEIGSFECEFAGGWDELSREELELVARLFMEKLNKYEFKLRAILGFMGIKKKVYKKLGAEDMCFLGESVNFLLDKEIVMTRNMFQVLSSRFQVFGFNKLYGPGDGLRNINLIEFANCDSRFISFKFQVPSFGFQVPGLKESESLLNEMLGVLWRRRKRFIWIEKILGRYDGDVREKYKDYRVKLNAKRIGRLPIETRLGMMMFYEGCRNVIISRHPNLFNQDNKGDGKYGWAGVITEIAGGKFGTQDEPAESNAMNVLLYLEMEAEKKFQVSG
jgi:hypothetical protein